MSAPDSTRGLWTRGGASPEVSRVTFEFSTNGGSTYHYLGPGVRVGQTANWEITGLYLPPQGQLRASGATTAGYQNGSMGFVQQVGTFLLAPTVTGITPATGPPSGGSAVTIVGSAFGSPATVTFDGMPATNVTVENAITVHATTPAHAAGVASVVVTTVGGSNAPNALYTYTPRPTWGRRPRRSARPPAGRASSWTGATSSA